MKQILYDKSGRVKTRDVPVPEIDKDEILVQNSFSVLSAGTEKSMELLTKKPLWKKAIEKSELAKQLLNFSKDKQPKTSEFMKKKHDIWHLLGYSSSGIVVKAGSNVKEFGVGDKVACVGSGFVNHAEYVAVPKTLACKIPKDTSSEDAAFAGIGAIALQSIRQLNPQLGENIVVVGVGLLGHITSKMLRANGCNVISIDIDKKKVRNEYVDTGITEDSAKAVLRATNGQGADGVIIATTSKQNLVSQAFDICRVKGRVVLLGVCGMEIQRDKMYEKEIEVKVSTAYGPGSFDKNYIEGNDYPIEHVRWTAQRNMKAFVELVGSGKLDMSQLSKNTYSFEEADKAYKKINEENTTTVLLSYGKKTSDARQTIEVNADFKKKNINVAIIGLGDFSTKVLIPSLKNERNMSIYSVATKDGSDAKTAAKDIGAKYASTSYMDVINDKNADIIVIDTKDSTHAEIANTALKKGKHVFCEKPMAIDEEEFNTLAETIKKGKSLYSCGFNKRYSSAINSIKKSLAQDVPMVINYIINMPYVSEEEQPEGQKQISSVFTREASQIVDLFNFLTGSRPITVEAQKICSAKGKFDDSENISVILKYHDGSVCTLVFSCMGNDSIENEKCTVIQDGTVFEMEGFGKVKQNGRVIYKGSADDGSYNQISELSNKLTGKESTLITGEECINTSRTTFDIVNKVKNQKK